MHYKPREVEDFSTTDKPMDKFLEVTWVQNKKVYIYVILFVCIRVIICVTVIFFESISIHNYPIIGKAEGASTDSRRSFLWLS